MIDIFHYHWVWYLIGFICVPRLTFMIFISIYFFNILPFWIIIIGWFYAILAVLKIEKTYYPSGELKSWNWTPE